MCFTNDEYRRANFIETHISLQRQLLSLYSNNSNECHMCPDIYLFSLLRANIHICARWSLPILHQDEPHNFWHFYLGFNMFDFFSSSIFSEDLCLSYLFHCNQHHQTFSKLINSVKTINPVKVTVSENLITMRKNLSILNYLYVMSY